MSEVTTYNEEMIEFIEAVQGWHENHVAQLQLIIDNSDAEMDFGGVKIEADSDLAKGIRTGVQVALAQLGKLPFSTEKTAPEDEDDLDLED